MDRELLQSIRDRSSVVDATCANANLRRATRAVTQMYDGYLAPSGLQATQFMLLSACAKAGPVTLSALAEALVMDRTTLTRNLRPLQARGLVKVAPGDDRRVRMVTLSEKGYSALARALPLWQEAQTEILKGFGQRRLTGLLQDLSALVQLARAG